MHDATITVTLAANPSNAYPFAVTGMRDAVAEYGPRRVAIQELLCASVRDCLIAANGMQAGFLAAGWGARIEWDARITRDA